MKKPLIFSTVLAATLIFTLYGAVAQATCTRCTSTGTGALTGVTNASDNSAFGFDALTSDSTGSTNTAVGANTLVDNTTGDENTAVGEEALLFNSTGFGNTASGALALQNNTTGVQNTASGTQALEANTTGGNNTATGVNTLASNTSGRNNTADGELALFSNATGYDNTGEGLQALYSNTTGYYNTASGLNALYSNTTGYYNTAAGLDALFSNTTGHSNIAIGLNAGYSLTTGSNNIDIGGNGAAGEGNTIRIGVQGTQTATYIAGISGATVTGSDVVISSAGRLGAVVSSARYKREIRDMGEASSSLLKLRPVTFKYKDDHEGTRQYGLVAEEVAPVYPELVVHGTDGKVESVRYSMLSAMLLNELQKQVRENKRQTNQIAKLSRQMAEMKADRDRERTERAAFEQRLSTLEHSLAAGNRTMKLAQASVR